MQIRRVFYLLLVLLLAGGVSAQEQVSESEGIPPLGNLNGYNGEPLNQTPGNCTFASGAFIAGQGYHISGAIGAFLDASWNLSATGSAVSIFDQNSPGDIQVNTAILVADDFGNVEDPSTSAVEDFSIDGLTGFLDGLVGSPELIPHGALVYHHINMLIAGTGLYGDVSNSQDFVEWQNQAGYLLRVVPVYTRDVNNDYSTQVIATNLQTEIGQLRSNGFDQVVINMSFAVVPCKIKEDFKAAQEAYDNDPDNAETRGRYDFNMYNQALLQNNSVLSNNLQVLLDSIKASVNSVNDPLFITITRGEGTSSSDEVRYIASSGNFGFDYPFFPAAWCEVLSVGAFDIGTNNRWDFTNFGKPQTNGAETYGEGAWYRLTDAVEADLGGSEHYYAGTSFAAPVMSVLATVTSVDDLKAKAISAGWLVNHVCASQEKHTASSGQTLTVTAEDASSGKVAKIQVINAAGEVLKPTDNPDEFTEVYVLPDDGEYTVVVVSDGKPATFEVVIS